MRRLMSASSSTTTAVRVYGSVTHPRRHPRHQAIQNGAMKCRTHTHVYPVRRPPTRTFGSDSVRLRSKTFERVCQEMAIWLLF
jgi:hypothetical protein